MLNRSENWPRSLQRLSLLGEIRLRARGVEADRAQQASKLKIGMGTSFDIPLDGTQQLKLDADKVRETRRVPLVHRRRPPGDGLDDAPGDGLRRHCA